MHNFFPYGLPRYADIKVAFSPDYVWQISSHSLTSVQLAKVSVENR